MLLPLPWDEASIAPESHSTTTTPSSLHRGSVTSSPSLRSVFQSTSGTFKVLSDVSLLTARKNIHLSPADHGF